MLLMTFDAFTHKNIVFTHYFPRKNVNHEKRRMESSSEMEG
jgi:hypothetical protein